MKNNFQIISQTLSLLDKIIGFHVDANHELLKKHILVKSSNMGDKLELFNNRINCFLYFIKSNNISEYKHIDDIKKISESVMRLILKESNKNEYEGDLSLFTDLQKKLLTYISGFKEHLIEYKNQHDMLTNLPLRKLMFKKINDLKNSNLNFYLSFIDIDYFKKINDHMGYEKGDEALIMVSDILYKYAGDQNLFRYGGEEFVMITETDNSDEVLSCIDKIYKDMKDLVVHSTKESINITLTTGIIRADLNKSAMELISESSALMQEAKKDGRNRFYFIKK